MAKSFHPDPLASNEENRRKYLQFESKAKKQAENLEDKLQCEMVVEYRNRFPEERGRLIGNDSSTMSAQHAAAKSSRGLVRGVSDLFFFHKDRYLVAMEIKYPGTEHDREHIIEQAKWIIKFPKVGWFVDSMEMFWDVILNDGAGIDANRVLENCLKSQKSKIMWEEAKK